MKAWVAERLGHYGEVLSLIEREAPKPSGSEALIRVKAIGLNFPDILAIAGKYQVKAAPPFVPGQEAMGEVIEAGPESAFRPGDRIMTMNPGGAFAEQMIAPAISSFRVPDGMTDADAAAFQMIYQTSYFALAIRARMQPGEVLLVHGGAGGVGTSAIQLGKVMGATVIATAGSDAKLEVCRKCGADHAINYTTDDFVERVKEITKGRGADVIYDPVGGDVFDKSTKCIAWNGRLVVIGFTSGRIPEIAANRILLKNMAVMGLFWGAYRMHEPHLIQEAQQTLYRYYAEGKIKPMIYREYPLAELPAALRAIEERSSYGKIVVVP